MIELYARIKTLIRGLFDQFKTSIDELGQVLTFEQIFAQFS